MANEILWTLVNTMIRINALLLIIRVFNVNPACRRTANVFLGISAVHGLATVLATCLRCQPVAAAWDNSIHGSCGNQAVTYIILESVGLLLDLVIVVMPQLLLCRLRMT